MKTNEIIDELRKLKHILEYKSEEIKQQELLKQLDAQRADWERRSALFVPLKNKLEKGGKTLEVGEDYEAIKDLRVLREKNKIRQSSLRDEMATARTNLHNSEEALNLAEGEYRLRLAEQSNLQNLIQKVKSLDEQLADSQEKVIQVHKEHEEAIRQHKECSARADNEQMVLEKIELSLKDVRKFLQLHSIDEKLQVSLAGIRKCFGMYEKAEEKRIALKNSWAKSIEQRQKTQSILNDRTALLSDVINRFSILEKNFVKAKAFYESTLKGKSIPEWRDICDKSTKKLADIEELYKKFHEVEALENQLKNLQDIKLRLQQETRTLNIRDVEQSGKINELQAQVEKLEKRSALLQRIQDLDAIRELLQDNVPCPLCGSITHPYVSGAAIPNPEEVHKSLFETQKALDELRDQLTTRQTRAGKINDEISSIGHDENELRQKINARKVDISSKVSLLGLTFGAGISPFEELDRERQKTRDILQLARNAADSAEAAEKDMKAANDELEKIRETRSEVTRYHQEALFNVQNSKTEEEQTENENKTQVEIVNSLKRELISQITPFGYKSIPDKNPEEIIKALEKRMNDWQENSKRSTELEHELSTANIKMTTLKKNRDSLKAKQDDLSNKARAFEAERDSIKQQRIILFASKNPDDEISRMNKNVEELKVKLNERREQKKEFAAKLDKILTQLHEVETEMATGRENLQKHEINFGKKLLTLGFRNEDDYAAACLTNDERRDLQNRLRELTREDLELKSERENVRAKILELQSHSDKLSNNDLVTKLTELKNSVSDEELKNENINALIQTMKKLILNCGLPEVF